MITHEVIERGDYVQYAIEFWDGIGWAREHGSGYVCSDHGDTLVVRNGDRELEVPRVSCTMRAKQYRLDV